MRLYLGVTDYNWYDFLRDKKLDEVNFWSPGGASFKVLKPGELFLFKLKAPYGHAIVGGGVFAHDTLLPLSLAWQTFGEGNGVQSLDAMRSRIGRYQSAEARNRRDPIIGCRLLQSPFFFEREAWFPAPPSFPVNAVSGKSYELESAEAIYVRQMLEDRLPWGALKAPSVDITPAGLEERTGKPRLVLPRLGQGSFRIAVLDTFGRRCAVTGERTLPILDAAHIQPWSEGGDHAPGNGLLLRTDVHRLFDLGYVTVSHDLRFEVSPRLREDYENGKEYYALHGRPLRHPTDPAFLPSQTALDWHHSNKWAHPGP